MLLVIGHAIVGALCWALVNVPESNVAMLMLSAILIVAIVACAGWVEAAGVLAWLTDERPLVVARRAIRGVPAFVVALLLFTAIWWLTGRALAWHDAHAGEIDAAVMSRFGSARTAWVHLVYTWTIRFVRWALGLSLALSLLSAGAALGPRAMLTRAWVTRALSPRRLIVLTALFVVFLVLPWQAVYWRPRGLPATSIEAAFVALKLGLIAIVAHIGWALMLRSTTRSYSFAPRRT